ncbi:glutathione S-transferase C-terminal domain-containing protein [Aerococcaceae bacterium DSM 111022]|nr:glutathione S-transferase C-terminal domain-containing protein [Aerococcaceae bacterium DSM 111022]
MTYFNQPFGTEEQPIQSGRYRLIRAEPCPYAHRPAIARELLGLDQHISLGTVNPVNTTNGWQFTEMDPETGVTSVPELYMNSEPDYDGTFSVPVLVDIASGKIVRKESLEILRDFTDTFKELHQSDTPDLYPQELREEIDKWNNIISDRLLSDVYKLGHTNDQEEYDTAVDRYFDFLEQMEERFSHNRYFIGDQLTETDIVLFTPLVRLDVAYNPVFSANKKQLTDYPHLSGYMRELYQIPAFKNTTNFEAIKAGYYTGTSGAHVYSRFIVPKGPDVSYWEVAYNRENM